MPTNIWKSVKENISKGATTNNEKHTKSLTICHRLYRKIYEEKNTKCEEKYTKAICEKLPQNLKSSHKTLNIGKIYMKSRYKI